MRTLRAESGVVTVPGVDNRLVAKATWSIPLLHRPQRRPTASAPGGSVEDDNKFIHDHTKADQHNLSSPTPPDQGIAYVPADVALWPRLTGAEIFELRGPGVDADYRDKLVDRDFGRLFPSSAERLAFLQQSEGGGVSGLENLDFFTDKSLVDDPYDYYDAIRRRPIWREPAHGVVMVSGYDEAIAVQRDPDQTFSVCNIVSGPWSGIPSETDRDDVSDLIERHRHRVTFGDYFITFDPPKHTAHRSLLNRLFTPRQLKNSDDFLWHLADEQLDRFIAEGKCEIVIDYNFPFTLDAITDLLDVPEADRERFRRAATPSRLEGERSGFVGVKEEWFIEQKIHTNADNYKLPQEFRDWQACAKDRDATIYKLSAAVVNLCQMVEYLGIGAATRRR